MYTSLRFESYLRLIVIVLVASLVFTGTSAAIGLFADGCYFLYRILEQRTFFDYDLSRKFVQLITQFPLIVGLKWGIRDINSLIYLHSFGLVAIPLFVWIAALIKQFTSAYFWLFVVVFSITYLSSGFFSVGEYNLTYALVGFSAAILLSHKPMKIIDSLALVGSAFVLILSYQSLLFLGPLLIVMTLLRINCEKPTLLVNVWLWVSVILLLTSTGISLFYVVYPNYPTIFARGVGNILLMMCSMHFTYLILMLFLFLNCYFSTNTWSLIIAGFLSVVHLSNHYFWNLPGMNYDFRGLSGVLLFFVLLLATLGHYRTILSINAANGALLAPLSAALKYVNSLTDKIKEVSPNPIPLFLFLSLLLPFYFQSMGFYLWSGEYEQLVMTHKGIIPIDQTSLAQKKFHWAWVNPCMSLLLKANQQGAILANASDYRGWQPFDPHNNSFEFMQSYSKKTRTFPRWNLTRSV